MVTVSASPGFGAKSAAALSGASNLISPPNTAIFSPPAASSVIVSAGGYLIAPGVTLAGPQRRIDRGRGDFYEFIRLRISMHRWCENQPCKRQDRRYNRSPPERTSFCIVGEQSGFARDH